MESGSSHEVGSTTLSVVIPARDEEGGIHDVLKSISRTLSNHAVQFELVVADDHSRDRTAEVVRQTSSPAGKIRLVANDRSPGVGNAIECGIRHAEGEVVAIMMGDGSDRPSDLVQYYRIVTGGVDCAFGSRFLEDSRLEGYPTVKLVLNRIGNWLVRVLFGYGYNDFTNAFKAYRASVLAEILPLRSRGFDVTLELPIRALRLGASYRVVPITWQGRSTGQSKMAISSDVWVYLRRLALLRWRSI